MEPVDRLPEELQRIGARLQAERAQADPLQLDQIKRRAMARASTGGRSIFMKSRLATLGTLVALAGGTGGAIAVGSSNNGNGFHASAASGQYCQGKDFDDAFNKGFDDGFNPGFHHGFNDGWRRGYKVGYERGYHTGLHRSADTASIAPGCGDVYNHSFNHSFNSIFNDIFNRAFNRRFDHGFNQGFNAAWRRRHG